MQLENGIEIEFDKKGSWEEADGNKNKIPFAMLPKNIGTYVTTNYKNSEVVKIEKEIGIMKSNLIMTWN